MKKIMLAVALAAASASAIADSAVYSNYVDVDATVLSVQPVSRQVPVYGPCGAPVQNGGSATGTIIGGIAGALLGNTVGHGNGRVAAAAAGAIAGGIVGNNFSGGSMAPGGQCMTGYQEISEGYTVTYSLPIQGGVPMTMHTTEAPIGNTVRVRLVAQPIF